MITAFRPAPLWLRFALVALELFTAGGALYGGWLLIADPSGVRIGFAPGLLDHTPFASYLVPGIVLFAVNGLGNLGAALAVAFGWRHATIASLAAGVLLTSWISVQVALIGYASGLQPIMLAVGLLTAGAALLARRATVG